MLLPQELSAEEVKLQNAEEIRTYKNKKEKLNLQDRLDLWNTALYGEKVAETLNATNSIAKQMKAQRSWTQQALLQSLNAENYAQAV